MQAGAGQRTARSTKLGKRKYDLHGACSQHEFVGLFVAHVAPNPEPPEPLKSRKSQALSEGPGQGGPAASKQPGFLRRMWGIRGMPCTLYTLHRPYRKCRVSNSVVSWCDL